MASEIAGIYQFIKNIKGSAGSSADFIAKADTNGDNVLLKHEFVEFLNLEGYHASDDIIEKFWKSIDANDSERRIENTDLKNYRAVTAEEIDYVEKVVKVYDEIKAEIDALKAPKNLKTSQVKKEWVQQMTAGLKDSYDSWLEKGIETDYDLATTMAELTEEITPKLAAKDAILDFPAFKGITDYNWEDDWNLQLGRNVKKMMKELSNKGAENIVSEVQKLVNGMLQNARVSNSGEATKFKQTAFTELQKLLLGKMLEQDQRVLSVLGNANTQVKDAVFERFYTMYYHYADNYFTDYSNDTTIRKEKLVQVFLDWFEQVGKEYMDGLGATPGVVPTTPVEQPTNVQYNLGEESWILDVDKGDTYQFQRPVVVYDQDGNMIDKSRISVYANGNIELVDFNHDGFAIVNPVYSSGSIGSLVVFVDQEEIGEIDIIANVSGAASSGSGSSSSEYYTGTVYTRVLVEDQFGNQHEEYWSFTIDEEDEIKNDRNVEENLKQLGYHKYEDTHYTWLLLEYKEFTY